MNISKNIETIRLITVGKLQKCNDCEIIFPSLGNLESDARVQEHMKARHMVPCEKCDKMFVSIAHKRYHEHFSHELQCPQCHRLCEGRCSGIVGAAAENVGKIAMKMMKQESINTIDDTEKAVEELMERIAGDKLELMQYYLDIGYVDCESEMWCTLLYYPAPEMPKKNLTEYTYCTPTWTCTWRHWID